MSNAYLPDGTIITIITMKGKKIVFSETENWYGREETQSISIAVDTHLIIKALLDLEKNSYKENDGYW